MNNFSFYHQRDEAFREIREKLQSLPYADAMTVISNLLDDFILHGEIYGNRDVLAPHGFPRRD